MDPRALLETWLSSGTLRASTIHARYRPEVTSWLDWCEYHGVHPYRADIRHVAAWAGTYLTKYLDGRLFDGPEALAYLAETNPGVAGSHDGRITAVTQYYTAARDRGLSGVPNLLDLRSGVDRNPGEPRKLTQDERDAFLSAIGGWGPDNARHYLRDRLIAYLLLEGLRPGEVVRLDMRHLYEQPDGTFDLRAPDDFENVGKKHTLGLLASEALRDYLPARIPPADGVHALIIGQGGKPIVSRYPNMLVQQIASLRAVLAQRRPPVTADALAHTGKREQPDD